MSVVLKDSSNKQFQFNQDDNKHDKINRYVSNISFLRLFAQIWRTACSASHWL